MNRIYMVRHGKPSAPWGEKSDPDPGLDLQGHDQARAVAEALMALPEGRGPTRVLSSPLRRCRETAAPFAERIGAAVEIDPRFGEIPTPAGLSESERGSWLRQVFTGRWSEATGDLDYDAWRRGIAEALGEQSSAAVFSHFVAINAAVTTATGEDKVLAFRPDYCSVTVFEAGPDGLRLIELGAEAQTQVL